MDLQGCEKKGTVGLPNPAEMKDLRKMSHQYIRKPLWVKKQRDERSKEGFSSIHQKTTLSEEINKEGSKEDWRNTISLITSVITRKDQCEQRTKED